jgi:hypothetical protein
MQDGAIFGFFQGLQRIMGDVFQMAKLAGPLAIGKLPRRVPDSSLLPRRLRRRSGTGLSAGRVGPLDARGLME